MQHSLQPLCSWSAAAGLRPPSCVECRKATKDAFFAESQKLKEADKEVADLEARLKLDLGSEGQFAALHDRCPLV